MRKVLVTGANGFVGQRLCSRLLAEGYRVRGAVRSSAAAAQLPEGTEVTPIEAIGPHTNWSRALQGVESVVHLAARVHVMREEAADPLAEFRYVNAAGTEHLARAAAKAGVRRLLYASSIKVNGECTGSAPFTEDDEPAPRDPYAVSKWEAERALRRLGLETGLETVIVRPPLVYGPGVKGNFLRLIQWVDKGVPLPFSMVHNRRSLVALDNLVDVLTRCVESQQVAGEILLVSDGEDLTTAELVRRIAKALGRRAMLFPCHPLLLRFAAKLLGMEHVSDRLLGSLVVDAGKAQRLLGWRPVVSVRDCLQQTANWYRSTR